MLTCCNTPFKYGGASHRQTDTRYDLGALPPGSFLLADQESPAVTRATLSPCSSPGCHNLTDGGPCASCRTQRDQRRGSSWSRGYGRAHQRRFRPGVLAKNNGLCVLCQIAAATVADHWPLSRRELVEAGLDPDDPQHGRPLCHVCHSKETAQHQPGGWNTT